jgi:zinc transporter ZupT
MKVGMKKETNGESNHFVSAGLTCCLPLLLIVIPELVPSALFFAAGVMIFITVDELTPAVHECGHELTSFGLIVDFILTLGLLSLGYRNK